MEKLELFTRALGRLQDALKVDISAPLAIDGTIQRFEFCFELCWKGLQVILFEYEGIEAKSPKQVLREAYALNLIDNEEVWITMLNDRNLTSHTYKEELALQIYQSIASYANAMNKLLFDITTKYKIT